MSVASTAVSSAKFAVVDSILALEHTFSAYFGLGCSSRFFSLLHIYIYIYIRVYIYTYVCIYIYKDCGSMYYTFETLAAMSISTRCKDTTKSHSENLKSTILLTWPGRVPWSREAELMQSQCGTVRCPSDIPGRPQQVAAEAEPSTESLVLHVCTVPWAREDGGSGVAFIVKQGFTWGL
jgi:hypothetical protein